MSSTELTTAAEPAALPLSGSRLAGLRSSRPLRQARAWAYRWLFHNRIRCHGPGHQVQFADSLLSGCHITLAGRFNRLEIEPGARLWGVTIRLHGERLHCHIGARCRLRGALLVLEDSGSRLHVGRKTTLIQPIIVVSEGGSIHLGEDCLLAYGTDLRNSDGHSVLDAAGGARLNPAADIHVEDHVWLGLHSQVLKGVRLGAGAVVAARAVVTHDVPPAALAVGIPARVLRTGIRWDHRRL